jgi:hypothetical protein
MSGSDISLAAGATSVVDLRESLDVIVHVRDTCGRPLEKAKVQLRGRVAETDRDGIAVISDVMLSSHTVAVVTYVASFGASPATQLTVTCTLLRDASFDPSPKEAPGSVRRELHAVVLLGVHYPLKHLFAWQRAALREAIYIDGVSVGRFKEAHPYDKPHKSRSARLRKVIELFDEDDRRWAVAERKLAREADDVATLEEKARGADARIAQREEVIKAGRGGAQLAKQQERERAAQASADEVLAKRRAKRDDTLAALKLLRQNHGGDTHESVLEHLLSRPRFASLEPWIRYGVVHLTGIRYRPSPGCYQPPRDIVRAFREKEAGGLEHASTGPRLEADEAVRQRRFARGYLALFRSDRALAAQVDGLLHAQRGRVRKGNGIHARRLSKVPLLELLERLARSEGPWLQATPVADAAEVRKTTPVVPIDLYELRAVAYATTEAILKRVGRDDGATRPPDQGEVIGTIVDRWFKGQIPEKVWLRAAMSTELLHDFFDPNAWDHVPDQWNAPKLDDVWAPRFPADMSGWQDAHRDTMQPFVTGAVCNDVAAILARARGLPIGGAMSIMAIAKELVRVAASLSGAARPVAAADGTALADGAEAGEPGAGHLGLFRAQTFAELRRGDILFWMQWTPVSGTGVREAHIVVPEDVNKLPMGPLPEAFAVRGKVPANLANLLAASPGFREALDAGLPDIWSLDQLPAKRGEVLYAIQRDRGMSTDRKPRKLADRIVRAFADGTAVAADASERDLDREPQREPEREPQRGREREPQRESERDAPPPDASVEPPPASSPASSSGAPPEREASPETPQPAAVMKYQALTYRHIGTVIDVRDDSVLFLETAAPVGVTERGAEVLVSPLCMWGRIPAGEAPDLEWFLRPSNLTDPARLDRDE